MLLTSATMRQSCRSFASAPVWQSWFSVDGAPVETIDRRGCRARRAAAAREHRVEDEDHEADDAEAAAAGEDRPAHAAAATYIGDLDGSSLAPLLNRMGSLLPRNWHSHAKAWLASTNSLRFRRRRHGYSLDLDRPAHWYASGAGGCGCGPDDAASSLASG